MDTPAGPHARLTAFGNELIGIHTWLREELAKLRADVHAHLEGRGDRPRELKVHCLTFCSALTRHHTSEDGVAFPALADQFPELRPTIEKLENDHELISGIVRTLEGLLDGIPQEPDETQARRVRSELDGLTAILESHFIFEERRITTALNELRAADATTKDLFGIGVDGS